jgi:hypothetical protein
MATAGSILNIGSGSGQNHFNLGVARDGDGSITTKTQAELVTYDESPYFSLDDTGVWTNFAVRLDGVTTEGSTYPRSELRELDTDGTTLYGFNPTTGDHWMQGRTIIDTLAAWKRAMVIGQLHDTISDVIMIASQNVEPSPYVVGGDTKIVVRINGGAGSGGLSLTAIPLYIPGTQIPWKIRTGSIGWEVYIGDLTTPMFKSSDPGMQALAASGLCYHKAGCYSNTNATVEAGAPLGNGSPSTFHVKCRLRDLKHWHTSWPTPQVMTSGTNFTPGTGVIGTPRFGAKLVSLNTGGDGVTPLIFTPAWPTTLPDPGDLVACIIWTWRASVSAPSTPSIASGWTSLVSDSLLAVAHGMRNRIYYTRYTAGMAAPGVSYSANTDSDVVAAQLLCVPGAWSSGDPTDQITAALTASAANSTTVIGPAPALGSQAPAGSVVLALIGHEYPRPSGTVTTVTGTDTPARTYTEVLEHIGTSPAGPTLAHDWAPMPAATTVVAKQATGTAGTTGKGFGRMWSIKPEPPLTHGIINACAGSS